MELSGGGGRTLSSLAGTMSTQGGLHPTSDTCGLEIASFWLLETINSMSVLGRLCAFS